jgi:hypothetical protein
MPKFHIDKHGNPAACSANVKACPLGGEHYDNMKDAQFYAFKQGLDQEKESWDKGFDNWVDDYASPAAPATEVLVSDGDVEDALEDRELDEVDARAYLENHGYASVMDAVRVKVRENDANGYGSWSNADELTTQDKHEIALQEVVVDIDRWTDGSTGRLALPVSDDPFDDPYWDDYEDPFAAVDDEFGVMESYTAPSECRSIECVSGDKFCAEHDGLSEDEEAILEVYAGLSDDPARQDEFAREKLRESIRENLAFFNSVAPELASLAIDDRENDRLAKELNTRAGRHTLHELVKTLGDRLRQDKAKAQADGTYVAMDFAQQEAVVTSIQHMINPRSGKSRGRREPRPIDPELIQALRFMYLKKFGVDPFEQGISVNELLAMLRSGELR